MTLPRKSAVVQFVVPNTLPLGSYGYTIQSTFATTSSSVNVRE